MHIYEVSQKISVDYNFSCITNRKLTLILFFNVVSLLFNALSHHCTSFLMTSEKKVLGWASSHARTAPLTFCSMVNRRILNASFSGSKCGSQKKKAQDCAEDKPILQNWLPECFRSASSSMWMDIVVQQLNTFDRSPRRLLRNQTLACQ